MDLSSGPEPLFSVDGDTRVGEIRLAQTSVSTSTSSAFTILLGRGVPFLLAGVNDFLLRPLLVVISSPSLSGIVVVVVRLLDGDLDGLIDMILCAPFSSSFSCSASTVTLIVHGLMLIFSDRAIDFVGEEYRDPIEGVASTKFCSFTLPSGLLKWLLPDRYALLVLRGGVWWTGELSAVNGSGDDPMDDIASDTHMRPISVPSHHQ